MQLSKKQESVPKDPAIELAEALGEYAHDPLKFVYFAFPWGAPGPLENMNGPEEWQKDILRSIRDGVKIKNKIVREAVASGHGIGKSCLEPGLFFGPCPPMNTQEESLPPTQTHSLEPKHGRNS